MMSNHDDKLTDIPQMIPERDELDSYRRQRSEPPEARKPAKPARVAPTESSAGVSSGWRLLAVAGLVFGLVATGAGVALFQQASARKSALEQSNRQLGLPRPARRRFRQEDRPEPVGDGEEGIEPRRQVEQRGQQVVRARRRVFETAGAAEVLNRANPVDVGRERVVAEHDPTHGCRRLHVEDRRVDRAARRHAIACHLDADRRGKTGDEQRGRRPRAEPLVRARRAPSGPARRVGGCGSGHLKSRLEKIHTAAVRTSAM